MLYRFNSNGSAAFANALAELSANPEPTDSDYEKIKQLSLNRDLLIEINDQCNLPTGPFDTRFEICSQIYDAIKDSSVIKNFNSSDSFWSWLSASYFDELTTVPSRNGLNQRKFSKEREAPAYIWHHSYKKAYRHRLGHGIFIIHHLGKALTKPLLLSHPGSMSDYCEQTFARVGSYKEKAVIEAANSIYFDGEKVLPGASGEKRWALQHLHREVAQCLINYEMHEMSADELLSFLPTSFKQQDFRT